MRLTTLYFYSLLWQFVICNSSQYSFSKYQNMLPNVEAEGNVVREFFDYLKKGYLEKDVTSRITIVTASVESMEEPQSLFENYPCIICTEPEKCVNHSLFNSGNLFVIFLGDLRVETVKRNLNILPDSQESKVLLITLGAIRIEDVFLLFNLTSKKNGAESLFLHVENNVMKFYADVVSEDCFLKVELIGVWTSGSGSNIIDTWFSRSRSLNGCPVLVTTLNFAPKMITKFEKNGSLIIEGGLEGEIILALAKKLNSSISLRYPSMEDRLNFSRKTAIVNEVAARKTDIGIGRLRPTAYTYEFMAVSIAYDNECVTWGVPRVMIWNDNVFSAGFSWVRWTLIGIIFVIVCCHGYFAYNINLMRDGNQKKVEFLSIIFDFLSIHLGNSVSFIPVSVSGKVLLIASLAYGILITTVYKTSLSSFMTTDDGSPGIVDAEGIIRANLSVGGESYNLDFLKDQANKNKTTLKLIERFIVNNNSTELLQRLKVDRKFAYLSRSSSLLYERWKVMLANEPVTFDIIEDCVLDHQTVILFRKELFFLREIADGVIRSLSEFGFLHHWDSAVIQAEEIIDLGSKDRKRFKDVFVIYAGCIGLSFFTFLVELIASAYWSEK